MDNNMAPNKFKRLPVSLIIHIQEYGAIINRDKELWMIYLSYYVIPQDKKWQEGNEYSGITEGDWRDIDLK